MSIQSDKLMNLGDGKVLYDDLRGRIPVIDDTAGTGATTKVVSANKHATDHSALLSAIDSLDNSKAPIIIDSASGAIATFSDGADDLPIESMTVQIEPVQSGSGDPSPDNVRPISGWTGANVARCGKNLLPKMTGYNANGLTATVNDDGSITVTGTATGAGGYITAFDYFPTMIPSGTTATIGITTPAPSQIRIFWGNGGTSDILANANSTTITTGIVQTAIRLYLFTTANTAYNFTIYPQFELGSTATAYEPYQGETYPITFDSAGTVYGGTLNPVTGELAVTHGQIASYAGETLPGAWISDRDVYAAGTTPTTGAQVVYELAEPLEYDLSDLPTIRTLLGANNIWADTGDVSVDYRADTRLYVDQHRTDVQINGSSITQDGVANIPYADTTNYGAVKLNHANGIGANNGVLYTIKPSDAEFKAGANLYKVITPGHQHISSFYGLAKAAGADMASMSSVTVGTYPDAQLKAIRKMLGIPNMKWELIKEVTASENVTELLVDTDSNGLGFKLRKIVAIFSAGASTTGNRDSFYISVGFMHATDVITSTSAPSLQYPSATSTMLARVEIEAEPGMPISTSAVIGSSAGNTQNVQKMPKEFIGKYVTAFRIYQSGSTKSLIPSGSTLKVYGIRYDD